MSGKIFEAIEFANQIHQGQYRKSTQIPELVHLVGVMTILIKAGCSEEVVIAGLLHDSLEDTATTARELEEKFGADVAKLIVGASEEDKSKPWEERKQETVDYLKKASIKVCLIVTADKLDNIIFTKEEYLRIGDKVWERFNRGKDKQRWYFESITQVLQQRLNAEPGKTLTKRLDSEVKFLFP